jgi:hypothetical protein
VLLCAAPKQVVADRVLLARLVLLREELRAIAEQQAATAFWGAAIGTQAGGTDTLGRPSSQQPQPAAAGDDSSSSTSSTSSSQPFFAFHRSNLPARCAAFLKNLLAVQDRTARLGLLGKVTFCAVSWHVRACLWWAGSGT